MVTSIGLICLDIGFEWRGEDWPGCEGRHGGLQEGPVMAEAAS